MPGKASHCIQKTFFVQLFMTQREPRVCIKYRLCSWKLSSEKVHFEKVLWFLNIHRDLLIFWHGKPNVRFSFIDRFSLIDYQALREYFTEKQSKLALRRTVKTTSKRKKEKYWKKSGQVRIRIATLREF